MKKISAISLACIFLLGVSCTPQEENDSNTFDRKALLDNIATELIIPNYEQLASTSAELTVQAELLASTPSAENLAATKQAFTNAYTAWQACSSFEFGPAATAIMKSLLNTYPTDVAQIQANIESGSFNLNQVSNIDASGFPALDYLLYHADEATVLTEMQNTNTNAYLLAICEQIESISAATLQAWKSGYYDTFVNATGTDVGSGLGMLVNELNRDFELIKNFKVGVPLGKRSLGEIFPEKVEAYYSKKSLDMALSNLQTIRLIITGDIADGNQIGLAEHLDAVNARYNEQLLSEAILQQLDKGIEAMEALNSPIDEAIVEQFAATETAYNELQSTVTLLKVDMPSQLAVLITYQDNDGD
ncbi:imelysin family protein [Cytophagales bacterium LB-30]|uniref:Imelysin family protein n=1 Tax=Shiella aurantiaca TaxID=3058365 RepID=A0ABT8F4C2_9BACT|nr:imelysin family protein [Shiella aurantiaca]MDN4165295.1 imelysin family protein [Shiella aurantiaca]